MLFENVHWPSVFLLSSTFVLLKKRLFSSIANLSIAVLQGAIFRGLYVFWTLAFPLRDS